MTGTSADLQGAIGGFGAAANSLFGGQGAKIAARAERKAAGLLGQAAGISRENVGISQESTRIKLAQAQRQIYSVIGGQQADIAGAGLAASGTALDLLADSQSQGDLTKYALEKQGEIDANAFEQQAISYQSQQTSMLAQAKAHEAQADNAGISAVINAVGGAASLAMFASDRRLKKNIVRVGCADNGLTIYQFEYTTNAISGDDFNFVLPPGRHLGFMADEVKAKHPRAVHNFGGWDFVDYNLAVL